jgi:hypothetical protein
MNPFDFPNAYKLVEAIRVRDTGALLVVMVVVTGAGLLANSRVFAPRLLPYVRAGLAGIYFASLFLMFGILMLELVP